jgi:hypothetical protein
MNNPNVYQYIFEKQEVSTDEIFICPLCEGSHGNNSLCQWSDWS